MKEKNNKDLLKNNKIRKWNFIFGFALILIIVAILLFIGYNKLSSNPSVIFNNTINELYSNIHNNIKELENKSLDLDISEDPFLLDIDAKLKTDLEDLATLENLNYNLKLYLDYPSKEASLGLNLKDNKETILNLNASLIDQNIKVSSPELYDKAIDFGKYDLFKEIDLKSIPNINYDDLDFIIKSLKDIFISSLNKENMTFKKDTLTINKKQEEVKKVSYTLNNKDIKALLKEINNNEQLITTLANIMNLSSKDIKTKINNLKIDDIKSLEIILYTDNWNNLILSTINKNNEEIMSYENKDDSYIINLTTDDNKISITGKENEINIKGYEQTEEVLNMTYKYSKNASNLTFNSNDLKGEYAVSNIKKSKDKLTSDFKLNLKTTNEFTIEGTSTLNKDKLDKASLGIDNTVSYEDLSNSEILKIYTNIEKILKKLNITDILG